MPLSQLRRITARGQGVTLALTGEAGVGKSERASRFLKTLPARLFTFSGQWPLARLATILPAALREPEWVGLLLARLSQGESLPAGDSARAVTERLLAHAPAVLLIDHFHRVPVDAGPFWSALAEHIRQSKGVGLLLLTRGEAPDGWEAEEVLPLTRPESDTLVRDNLGEAYRADLATWLFEKAQGHPLLTLELLSSLRTSGMLESGDWATAPPDLPNSIQAFVRAQLPTQLTPELQETLARELLQSELEEAPQDGPCQLKGYGLRPDQLTHPLYHEALLSIVSPEVWAGVLEEEEQTGGQPSAALLAQWAAAWPLSDATRLKLYRRAAQELEERQELTRAAEFWEKAAESCSAQAGQAQRAQWLRRAARLYKFYPLQKDLHLRRLLVLRKAVQTAGADVPAEWLTALAEAQGTARLPLEELAELLPGSLQDWQNDYLHGLFQAATPLEPRAITAWDALTPEERQAMPALSLSGVANALYCVRLEEAQALWERAQEGAEGELVHLHIRADAAYAPFFLMENETALHEFDAVVVRLETLRRERLNGTPPSERTLEQRLDLDRAEQLLQTCNRARAALNGRLGRMDECAVLYDSVLSYAARRQALTLYAGTLQRYGWELVNGGRFEEAQRLLRQAYSTGLTLNFILMAQIDLYFLWHRDEQVHLLAHATSELLRSMTEPIPLQAYFMAALGLTACGDWGAALSQLDEGEAKARAAQVGHALDFGLWIRGVWHGEQGQKVEAARWTQEAADASRARGLAREANRYALWAAHYRGNEEAFRRAAQAVEEQGDRGHLHAVQARRGEVAQPTQAHLQILGTPRLLDAAGQPVRSAVGLRLLMRLLHARLLGEAEVRMTELTTQLYPDAPAELGRRNVSRLVRGLSRRLGAEVVVQTAHGYALGEVSSDAELFLNEGAADLWRGPLLPDEAPRADAVAERLLSRLREHIVQLLPEEPAQAVRLAAFLTESEPYDLAALRLRLHAHDLAGQPGQVRKTYAVARRTFAELGEELPDDWRTFLASGEASLPRPARFTTSARAASRARVLHVHRSTIARWDAGISAAGKPGRRPKLTAEQVETLKRVVQVSPEAVRVQAPRWTLRLVAEYAEEVFGVRLSQAQLSRLLREEKS